MTAIAEDTFGIRLQPYAALQPKQDDFLADGSKYGLMGGSSGGGKSYACRARGFTSNVILPGIKGLVLRRSRGEVIKNFVEPLVEETRYTDVDDVSKPYLRWVPSQNVVHFPNGSRIDVGYCEDRRDVERYRGLEYDWICIEELTQWEEESFRKVMSSLRTRKPGVRPFFFGSCNPGGIGHGWVKRLWISREYHDNEVASDYGMVRANIWDNPALMAADPEYIQNLMALPEKERRARLYGDWDVFEGQYFNEYRENIHVVEPFYPVGLVRRIIAIDYGHKKPCAVLWMGLDTQGRVWVYRELYGTGMGYAELAKRIKALTGEEETIDFIVVDPAAINKETEDTKTTLSKEFKAAGLPYVEPGINDRLEGWLTVRYFLLPYKDPNTGEMTSMLQIGRNCRNLIRTLPDQVHDDRNPEDMNSKGEDHAVDALRYGLMALAVNIESLSDIGRINTSLGKGAARHDLNEKERELLDRGRGDDTPNILRQEF